MSAMSEPAYVPPDDEGTFHLLVDGEPKTYRIDHDEAGRPFLCEILPYESLPDQVREVIEAGEAHPERWIRRERRTQAS